MNNRQYICAGKEYNTIKRHVNAPLFMRSFTLQTFQKATIEISAVGFYRLFVNGVDITKGFFAPYISNPDHFVYYDEYEAEGFLKAGQNTLEVLLGNGFSDCNDNGIWDFEKASFRAAPKFFLRLTTDGKEVLSTDESFSVCDSPITFDDLRCGERYDANLENNFRNGVRKALSAELPKGVYKKCTAQPVTVEKELTPVRIDRCKSGYVYDFGENNSGVCRLRIDGAKGQRLDMYFGELIGEDGVDQSNIAFGERSPADYVQHDVYVCKEGVQTYTPSFTYHGFRYVLVRGIGEQQATKDLLTFLVLHSQIPQRATFECSDETVNKIQQCTLRSDVSNFHYFPTDCPHREKNGWTGDIVFSAEQMAFNFNAYDSFAEWLNNLRATQREDGQIPGIVPTSGWGYDWGNGMVWDSVLAELPYQLYRFHGKKEIIEQNADAIRRYVDYMRGRVNADGLLDYGLGDWCEAGAVNEAVSDTPLEVCASLVGIDFLQKAAFLFAEVQRRADAASAKAFCESLRQAFRAKYIRQDRVVCRSQTAQALALSLHLFDNEEEAYVYLKTLIAQNDGRFKVGVLGAKYLFPVLSEHGDGALALKMVVGPAFPSYGYWIQLGCTTLCEAFQQYDVGSPYPRRTDGGTAILSFNHHFFGSVSAWFMQYLAGIRVLSAEEIEVRPDVRCGLTSVKASFANEFGSVRVQWNRERLTVENEGFRGKIVCGEQSVDLTDGRLILPIAG